MKCLNNRLLFISVTLLLVANFSFSHAEELNLDGNRYLAFAKVDGTGELDKKGKHTLPYYLVLGHIPETGALWGSLVTTNIEQKNGVATSFFLESFFIDNSKIKGTKKLIFDLEQNGEIVLKKVKVKITDNGKTLKTKLKNSNGKKVPLTFELITSDEGGIYLGDTNSTVPADGNAKGNTVVGVNKGNKNNDPNYGSLAVIANQVSSLLARMEGVGQGNSDLFGFNDDGDLSLQFLKKKAAFYAKVEGSFYDNNSFHNGTIMPMGNPKPVQLDFEIDDATISGTLSPDHFIVRIEIKNIKFLSDGFKVKIFKDDDTQPIKNFRFTLNRKNNTATITFVTNDRYFGSGSVVMTNPQAGGGGEQEVGFNLDRID